MMEEEVKAEDTLLAPEEHIQEGIEMFNGFIGRYKGILTAVILAIMIALTIYLIFNLQMMKMNPVEYCNKALSTSKCIYTCMP